jgi:NAD+ kinase
MCRGNNFYQFVIKKFGQLGDPVANDVLKQLARQLANPMSAVADHSEFRNVLSVDIAEERGIGLRLMFDPGHELHDRILAEQFRF